MRAALVIAAKDLRQRLRDRSAVIVAVVAPVVLASIVTGAFGSGFGPDGFDTSFVVLDHDRSELSRAFVDDVLGSEDVAAFATVTELCPGDAGACDTDDVRSSLDGEDAFAAFIVPAGFGQRVLAGGEASLTVVGTGDAPISEQIARSIAQGFSGQVTATRTAIFTAVRANDQDASRVGEFAAEAANERIPVVLADADVARRDVSGANYFGPSMAIFFVFFTVSLGAQGLLAERANGTLARLLAAPVGRATVIGGKALAILAIGLASMGVMYAFMGIAFGVDWGDPLAVAALTVLIVAAAMGVTAIVQTLARTQEQAGTYGTAVGMIFALLGGNFFPLFQLPALMQTIALATPNGWALRGFTEIAYDGAGLGDLVPNVIALSTFVVITSSIALYRSRRLALT